MLFIILFFKGAIYSQSLDEIKKVDTIYIYFDRNKKYSNSIREETFGNEKSEFYKNYVTYRFNSDPMNIISFSTNKNRDDIKKGIKNDERIEKKSFLKKNKNIILDFDFFVKNGILVTYFTIYEKTIYLIDKDEIKGRKIKIRQVDIGCSTCHGE